MSAPRYQQPLPARATDVVGALADGRDPVETASLLVGAAGSDPDWKAVQEICIALITGPDVDLAAVAVTCLGDIARIHGSLDLGRVGPLLQAALKNEALVGRAEDALDDIETYIGTRPRVDPY